MQNRPLMWITYDPDTQRGLVLRLRSGLGKRIALQFLPIGVKRGREEKGKEKVEPEPEPEKKKRKKELTPEEEAPAQMLQLLTVMEEEKREEIERMEIEEEEGEEAMEARAQRKEAKRKIEKKKRKDEERERKAKKEKERKKEEAEKGPFPFLYPPPPPEGVKSWEEIPLEKRPPVLPVEVAWLIYLAMFKDFDPKSAAALFRFGVASKEQVKLFQDEGGSLENALSLALLGVRHTRTREERKLGIDEHVEQTFRWVLSYLGQAMAIDVQKLQSIANRNRRVVEQIPTFLPKAWPWWYLALLSNWRAKESVSELLSETSDPFAASIITFYGKFGIHRKIVEGAYPVSKILNIGYKRLYTRRKWERGVAGADLMTVPLDSICQRAIKRFRRIKSKLYTASLNPDIKIFISLVEPMVYTRIPTDIYKTTAFRKEVVFTGIENVEKLLLSEEKGLKIHLDLNINDAFFPSTTTNFLESLPLDFLDIQYLWLSHIHFDNQTHLSRISHSTLKDLEIGPTNLSELLLPCPVALKRLHLVNQSDDKTFNWSINDAQCYSTLKKLTLIGNIPIWEEPTISSIPHLPSLTKVVIGRFQGDVKQVHSLIRAFEEMKLQQSNLVSVLIRPIDKTLWKRLAEEFKIDIGALRDKGLNLDLKEN